MWTLLLIAALVLISFRMFIWQHKDRDRMPFEATLADEDRARLHQLIDRTIDRSRDPHTDMRSRPSHGYAVKLALFHEVSTAITGSAGWSPGKPPICSSRRLDRGRPREKSGSQPGPSVPGVRWGEVGNAASHHKRLPIAKGRRTEVCAPFPASPLAPGVSNSNDEITAGLRLT